MAISRESHNFRGPHDQRFRFLMHPCGPTSHEIDGTNKQYKTLKSIERKKKSISIYKTGGDGEEKPNLVIAERSWRGRRETMDEKWSGGGFHSDISTTHLRTPFSISRTRVAGGRGGLGLTCFDFSHREINGSDPILDPEPTSLWAQACTATIHSNIFCSKIFKYFILWCSIIL